MLLAMRWCRMSRIALLGFMLCLLLPPLMAEEFELFDGTIYRGELVAADENGFVVRLENASYSPRTDWAKLTDGTLERLVRDDRARQYVEVFVTPPEPVVRPASQEIRISEPPKVTNPENVSKGFGKALITPGGFVFLAALFLGNLYVAYEIARFKWRPVPLVCGVSAVLPLIGPAIFLVLPKHVPEEEVNATEEAAALSNLAVTESAPSVMKSMGLRVGGGEAAAEFPKAFKRGDFTFNRRFFETQFPNFFRVVASEAEKDLVLEIQCARGPVVASRITKISQNDLHVRTAAGAEVPVEFAGITLVTLTKISG